LDVIFIDREGQATFTAQLNTEDLVIPATAGIQKSPGFRVKPGMTNWIRFISSWIVLICLIIVNFRHLLCTLRSSFAI